VSPTVPPLDGLPGENGSRRLSPGPAGGRSGHRRNEPVSRGLEVQRTAVAFQAAVGTRSTRIGAWQREFTGLGPAYAAGRQRKAMPAGSSGKLRGFLRSAMGSAPGPSPGNLLRTAGVLRPAPKPRFVPASARVQRDPLLSLVHAPCLPGASGVRSFTRAPRPYRSGAPQRDREISDVSQRRVGRLSLLNDGLAGGLLHRDVNTRGEPQAAAAPSASSVIERVSLCRWTSGRPTTSRNAA
jgi:hypothetical protein